MSNKCVVKKKKNNEPGAIVTFDLTAGQLLALTHALDAYARESSVGKDVQMLLNRGLENIK